jgi:hypothetical protein
MAICCTDKVFFNDQTYNRREYVYLMFKIFHFSFLYMHGNPKTSAPPEKLLLHPRSSKPRKDRSSTTGKPKTVAFWGTDGRATGTILEAFGK